MELVSTALLSSFATRSAFTDYLKFYKNDRVAEVASKNDEYHIYSKNIETYQILRF